jgi:hypothetical protein
MRPVERPAEYTDEMIVDSFRAILGDHTGRQWINGAIADVAAGMIDHAVSHGEYAGCSTEMELAYPEYEARIRRVLRDGGEDV